MQNEKYRQTEKSEQGQLDYVAFDQVLDIVRNVFLSLHGAFANEERWRWDTPVITFTWTNGQDINRNLNGLVLGGTRPTGIQVESNAWKDIHQGSTLIRYWRNFPAGKIVTTSLSQENIASLVEKAYKKVASCTTKDLKKHDVLSHSGQDLL